MPQACRNIYKIARKAAGYTQERAAELLVVSVESLRAYETGMRIPPNDVVAGMVEIYNHQVLALQHLRNSCEFAASIIPVIPEDITLSEAAIQLWDAARSMQEVVEILMLIGRDNIVHAHERNDFKEALTKGDCIIAAFLAIKCAKTKEQVHENI